MVRHVTVLIIVDRFIMAVAIDYIQLLSRQEQKRTSMASSKTNRPKVVLGCFLEFFPKQIDRALAFILYYSGVKVISALKKCLPLSYSR
jgi:hypothetical protein